MRLRGFLSHIQQVRVGYWGISSVKTQSLSQGLHSPRTKDNVDDGQSPTEASGVGRSWVQSMFSRDTASRANSIGRDRRWTSEGGASGTDLWLLVNENCAFIFSCNRYS